MSDEHPGLRKRLEQEARRVASQHRQLDELLGLVAESLSAGERGPAARAFDRFADALLAHFELEDQVYFPAVNGFQSSLVAELESLSDEHVRFRGDLARLRRSFAASPLSDCMKALERFLVDLAAHEGREERVMRSVGNPGPGDEAESAKRDDSEEPGCPR